MRLQAEPYIEHTVDELFAQKREEAAGRRPRTRASRIILSHLGTDVPALPPPFNATFPYMETGYATNIVLYPWDSVQHPTWPTRFLDLGSFVRSGWSAAARDHHGFIVEERLLWAADSASGDGIVADTLVFNWTPRQVNRSPSTGAHDSTLQNSRFPFDNRRGSLAHSTIWHVIARLRLTRPRAAVPADSGVLRVHLYHERSDGPVAHCTTFVVRKKDLRQSYNGDYSDVVFTTDFKRCGDGPGPLDSAAPGGINLSIERASAEDVALHSITLRHAPAHWLMDTTTVEGESLNAAMRSHLLRMLYGPTRIIHPDSLRPVIAIASGIEHAAMEADAFPLCGDS
jgi:hypothetical protein